MSSSSEESNPNTPDQPGIPSPPPQIRPHHLEKLAVLYVRQSALVDTRRALAEQQALVDLMEQWGWPESTIRIIEDLGRAGLPSSPRPGLGQLRALVESGQVGLVLVRDLSRISRDTVELACFLAIARRAEVLIGVGDDGRVIDPTADASQLFGLLQVLATRAEHGHRTARAARARAMCRWPPLGYVRLGGGQWIKDPTATTRKLVRRLFACYQSWRGRRARGDE